MSIEEHLHVSLGTQSCPFTIIHMSLEGHLNIP